MKRKFGFNIPPLKIPSRAENKALRDLLAGHDLSSPVSPPSSPYISRQYVDWKTEAELKKACAAIAKGCLAEPDTKLNFKPLHETKSINRQHDSRLQNTRPDTTIISYANKPAAHSTTHLPVQDKSNRAVVGSRSVQDLRQSVTRTRQEPGHGILSIREHPLRVDTGTIDTHASVTTSPSVYRPKTASDASYSTTPRTGSTDRHYNATSTAFTSAAMTPSRPSKSMSTHHVLDPASYEAVIREADEKAGAWMKDQAERKEQKQQGTILSIRPESRSWGLRSERQDSARPNTAANPRAKSRDSHYRNDSAARQSSSSHGWRPFSMLKNSSQTSFREGQSSGVVKDPIATQHEEVASTTKDQVDLNRQLPPLPSVDNWQQHYKDIATAGSEPTTLTSPAQATHIATLVKTGSQNITPVENSNSTNHEEGVSAAHSKASSAESCISPTNSTSRAVSGDSTQPRPHIMSKSTTSLLQERKASPESRATSSASLVIPNFSRKISIDIHGGLRTGDITALPSIPPSSKQHQNGLRRVLSRFDLAVKKNEKALTWMDLIEQEGVKTGIMIQRPAAATPIVRY